MTLLRRDGHSVDIVSSGQAAIETVQRCNYDLVLMDATLSGMNCQEATRAIRLLTEPVRSMPIIALATEASPEKRASAQFFGMNGFLDEPLSLRSFADVSHAHVWSGHRSGNASSLDPDVWTKAGSIHPEATERHSVHATLSTDRILELRSNLAPQTFVTLIEECLMDLAGRLPALRGAFVAGSTSAITVHSHAMVGMAAGYGMETLEMSLRTIMAAARAGDMGSLGLNTIAQVEREFASATVALRAMLQGCTCLSELPWLSGAFCAGWLTICSPATSRLY